MANETSKTSETPSTNKVTLSGNVLEKLYQRYSIKQRRAGLECFLAASILFDLWAIFVPQGQSWESLGLTCVFLLFNLLVIIFIKIFKRSKHRGSLYDVTPLIAWIIAIVQLFLQLFLKGAVTPRDSLGWAILLNFLVYVSLPIPLKYTGILFGVGSYTLHLSTTLVLPKKDEFFIQQQFTNALLMITAASIGLLCYFMGEAKHKRAFLEAKQSLEVKMVIEEQSAEQITSILPEHVAVKMRQDLGSDDSEQFKKIYMSRHENVSILYADIVGFTAISSTYSAQDLVKMLNELFARFDRLAEKYQQLRIKILGDCYYCISGAPVERPDHAVLCVHMGLSMVKAIKYVQKKANSPVDMRVGIHTGAILAGILGQRQWQFDVYSKDVELANKMESSGMAGRVHISEKTLGFLSGEFEVEPAFGEKREEALRIAGLKTYFIKKVLKPFVSTNSEHTNGLSKIDTDGSIKSDCPSISSTEDDEKTHATGEYDVAESLPDKEDDFKQRLKKELLSRDRHGELSKDTTIFLTFKNKELEKSYSAHKQPLSAIPLVASPSWLHFCISLSPIFLVLLFVTATVGETLTEILPDSICMASKKFNNVVCLRRFAAIVIIFSVGFSNILDMCTCTLGTIPLAGGNYTFNITTEPEIFPSTVCLLFPSYFSNYAVLILIATSLVAQLSHICKICIMIVIAGMHCGVNIFLLDEYFRAEEYHTWNARLPIYYSLSALLVAVTIALGFLTRHFVSTNSEHTNGLSKIDTDGSIKSDCPSISSTEDDEKTHATGEYDVAESLPDKEDDFKQRLKKELLSRDRHGELSKDTTIFLTFKNKELEKSYSAHKQPLSAIPLVASPLVLLVGTIYSSLILILICSSWLHFCISLSPIFLVLLFVTATVGETLTEILPDSICMASKKFNNVVCLRRFAAIVIIFSVGFSNILDMCTCTLGTIPLAGGNYTFNITTEPEIFPSTVCLLFPSYFSNYAVLILIATSLVAQLSHICKICIMIVIAGMHCGVNIFLLDEYFRAEEYHTWNARLPIYYSLSALLVAVTIALGFLTRHMDKEDRVIFKWRNEVNEQREKASDMRRRNEALVYNILPVHVAEHFMRNKQRSYDQLYSQSYEEVGVLFASMPNFSDFYSEDTVNNQGLECLRFLNEVISDFDALLELPKYQDVNKIKTIGSTYMAASGLNPVTRVKPDDPVVIRWEHLSILVEFALELKKALQCINEQSFNHFVLKMGINHGPITAGVIGARKPHYDIWGNTVNVASRMESTGKAGAIQVTEETCEILQTFGYTFEQRGLVAVKGKGQLMTYYLQGKTIRQNSIHSSPILAAINPMETLPEMDESKESTPPNETSGSMIPSISSSSNSPNSVKVNQTYLRSQPNQSAQNETTSIELNVTKINTNDVENENVDNLSMASNDNITLVICSGNNTILDMDNEASTPLLDAKNSTNSNAINSDYSDSEKEALIFSSNSLS